MRRRVTFKVIKAGRDTPEVITRCAAERQGWTLEGEGQAASDDDIRGILALLTQLQINADWDLNGNISNTRLDEVSIVAP